MGSALRGIVIVPDEQLEGGQLENAIRKWYREAVGNLADLRPGTIIKDDAIPQLLRKGSKPSFITMNVRLSWREVSIDWQFSVICFNLTDKDIQQIPTLLRSLFRHSRFRTKQQRVGYVFHINRDGAIYYYSFDDRQIRSLV